MWAFAAAFLAWAAWLWPDVPARIPTHFGAGGEPDAWADRAAWAWFGLPAIALVLVLLMDRGTRYVLRNPDLPGLNLPNKAAILALPPQRRAPVIARVAAMTYAIGAACVVTFALIQLGIWAEAHGQSGQAWVLAGTVVGFGGPLFALVVGLVRVDAEVKRQRGGP